MYTLVENYFKLIRKNKREKKKIEANNGANSEANGGGASSTSNRYTSPIIPRFLINCLITNLSRDPDVLPAKNLLAESERRPKLSFRMAAFIVMKTLKKRDVILYKDKQQIKSSEKYKQKIREYEERILRMAPQIEGRSKLIDDDVRIEFIFVFLF